MTKHRRTRLILLVAVSLCLLSRAGAAQQENPVDPWQFPKFTESKQFKRWWWHFQQRSYPLDDIPDGALLRALRQIEQSKATSPSPSQPVRSALASLSQPVQGTTWVNIGPAPINGIQIGSSGNTRPMSGRIAAIAVHPGDPNQWLIAAAQGGVWRTVDAGATWTPLTDAQASLAMGAIAFAPSSPW